MALALHLEDSTLAKPWKPELWTDTLDFPHLREVKEMGNHVGLQAKYQGLLFQKGAQEARSSG